MSREHVRRGAFTVKELVAVSVLLVLGGALLLPSVRTSHVSSRVHTCRNNMRNVGLAITNFEDAKRRYPGFNNELDQGAGSKHNCRRSFAFAILPYMDHRALYDELTSSDLPNDELDQTIEVFLCPTETRHPVRIAGAMNYVVNTGQLDFPADSQRSADFAANGVFHAGAATTPDEKLVVVSAADVAAGDGLGTTLMLSENVDARRWSDTSERFTGFTWHHANGQPGPSVAYPLRPLGINVRTGESAHANRQSAPGFARPSSSHPNGINVLYCDNHVRFMSDKIGYGIYQALMTPNGKLAVDNSLPNAPPLPAGHAAALPVTEADFVP
jgi:prepilin-type processing-associated H-X9-DG protein